MPLGFGKYSQQLLDTMDEYKRANPGKPFVQTEFKKYLETLGTIATNKALSEKLIKELNSSSDELIPVGPAIPANSSGSSSAPPAGSTAPPEPMELDKTEKVPKEKDVKMKDVPRYVTMNKELQARNMTIDAIETDHSEGTIPLPLQVNTSYRIAAPTESSESSKSSHYKSANGSYYASDSSIDGIPEPKYITSVKEDIVAIRVVPTTTTVIAAPGPPQVSQFIKRMVERAEQTKETEIRKRVISNTSSTATQGRHKFRAANPISRRHSMKILDHPAIKNPHRGSI
jgi:hypothetical protein